MKYQDLQFHKETLFLVTGGAGFIGSNLCEAILNMGYRCRCLDDLSTGKQENVDLFAQNPSYEFVKGDITDPDTCIKACQGVDYVLHQAAWGSVPRSIEMPQIYAQINILGTLNMLEAARRAQVKKFVYASSSSVYGDDPNLPKKEGREGHVLSPYALTKKCVEDWARQYTLHYGLPTVGLRYFNVFGKRQNPNGPYAAVIPKFIKQILDAQQPVIYGDGTQSRDFTYIENVIEANLKACLASSEADGEVMNIAYGGNECLNDVFRTLTMLLHKDIAPQYTFSRKGDIMHSHADISKARALIHYDPQWSFQQGLVQTIDWYCENL